MRLGLSCRIPHRGETSRKFQISARAEPKVSRAEPSHEPEILNFFRAEPSSSQHLVEPSRAIIFSSRARAEPRAIFLVKFSEIFHQSSEAQMVSNQMLRVLLSCGLQESACGPHGLPTDPLFLTNMRTPIIFFPSCYKLFVCCCQTAGLLLHKSGSPQQQTNMRTPNLIFLK